MSVSVPLLQSQIGQSAKEMQWGDSRKLPLTVAVNMCKKTNASKAFVGFGFPVGFLICVFLFILLVVFENSQRSKHLPVEAVSAS